MAKKKNTGDNSTFEDHYNKSLTDNINRQIRLDNQSAKTKELADKVAERTAKAAYLSSDLPNQQKIVDSIVQGMDAQLEKYEKVNGKNTFPGYSQAQHDLLFDEKLRLTSMQEEAEKLNADKTVSGSIEQAQHRLKYRQVNSIEKAAGQAMQRSEAKYGLESKELRTAITAIKKDPSIISEVHKMSQQTTAELYAQGASFQQKQVALKGQLQDILSDPAVEKDEYGNIIGMSKEQQTKINSVEDLLKGNTVNLAKVEMATSVQKKSGRDTASLVETALGYGEKIKKEQAESDAVMGGREDIERMGAKEALQKALEAEIEARNKATKAIEAHEEALKNNADNIDDMAKDAIAAYEDQKNAEKKTQTIRRESEESSYSRYRKYSMIGQAVQGAAFAAADATSFLGYKHESEKDSLRAKYAGMFQRQYEDVHRAGQLDAGAQRRILFAYEQAQMTAAGARSAGQGAGYLTGGGQILGGLLSGAAAVGLASTGVGAGGAYLIGTGVAAPQMVNGAKTLYSAFSGEYGAMAEYERYTTRLDALDQLSGIDDARRTRFQRAQFSLAEAMTGMGGRAGNIYSNLRGRDFDEKLREAGIDRYTDLPQVAALLKQTTGALTTEQDILTVGKLNRQGTLGFAESTAALGMLRTAGGSAADLEKIIKNAVAGGMDDAKSIMALVQSISNMATQIAATTGVDPTEAMRTSIFNAQQAGVAAGLTPEAARMGAQRAFQLTSDLSKDKSYNYANLRELQRIKQAANDAGVTLNLRDIDTLQGEDIKNLNQIVMEKDPNKLKDTMTRLGYEPIYNQLGGDTTKIKDFFKDIRKASIGSMVDRTAGILMDPAIIRSKMESVFTLEDVEDQKAAFAKLSTRERADIIKIMRAPGNEVLATQFGAALAINAPNARMAQGEVLEQKKKYIEYQLNALGDPTEKQKTAFAAWKTQSMLTPTPMPKEVQDFLSDEEQRYKLKQELIDTTTEMSVFKTNVKQTQSGISNQDFRGPAEAYGEIIVGILNEKIKMDPKIIDKIQRQQQEIATGFSGLPGKLSSAASKLEAAGEALGKAATKLGVKPADLDKATRQSAWGFSEGVNAHWNALKSTASDVSENLGKAWDAL